MRRIRHFLRSRRGNIAAMTALLLVPLVTIMGVATQAGSWFLVERALQNAADSAVIAAATNGGNGGTDYVAEAKSVASSYGFTDGTGTVAVTVPAPATYAGVNSCATSTCYNVKISMVQPLYLLQLIGYTGNATVGGNRGQQIVAGALATLKTINAPFCLSALGGGGSGKKGDAITANGVPASSIACNIQSAGNANCNGANGLTTGWSDAVGSDDCGTKQHTVSSVTDPYASLASNIPPNPCGSTYPTVPVKKSDPALPASNMWTSSSLPANPICGDYQLQHDVALSTGGTLVIENGSLDLNGHTLSTTGTAGLTIILTGTSSSSYSHVIESTSGGGTLNISSQTSGTWSGMAIYQDPNVAMQNLTYAGNSPSWDISGIIYMPKTNLTASGSVLQATNGHACFTLVVNTIVVNGTGDLFYQNPQSECPLQGVTSPTNAAYVIGELVY